LRALESDARLILEKGPERHPRARARTLRALESCRTAAWMQLGPSVLGVTRHMVNMDVCRD